MTRLVSLAEAKNHLRVDSVYDDEEIIAKLEQASAIVLRHLKVPVPAWPDFKAEADVRAATLLTLSDLFDGMNDMQGAARAILHPLRTPTVA